MNELSVSENHPRRHTGAHRCARERGEGRAKAIMGTLLLAMFVYTCFKVAPAYMNDYQLKDKMEQEARFAVVNRKSEEDLREIIFREIQELNIPAKKEDIKIDLGGRGVKISLDYVVPLDLIFYHGEMHFSPSSESKPLV